MSLIDEHLEAMVRRVIGEELRARGLAPVAYSSVSLPPDLKSADRFHRIVRKVPGAWKAGRVWYCPADAWHAYRAGTRSAPVDDTASVVARMLRA